MPVVPKTEARVSLLTFSNMSAPYEVLEAGRMTAPPAKIRTEAIDCSC
jgi:hypothetical protein